MTLHARRARPGLNGTFVYDDGSGIAATSGDAGVWPIGPAANPANPAPSSIIESKFWIGTSFAFGLPCMSTNCAKKNSMPSSCARWRSSSVVVGAPPAAMFPAPCSPPTP